MLHDRNKITKRANGRIRVQSIPDEVSKTQQQFKDDCDINLILKKHTTGQDISQYYRQDGVYADLSTYNDYRDMLDAVKLAEDAFSALPAETRKRFQNDPQELIKFLGDSKNQDEAVKLGLVNPPKVNESSVNKQNVTTNDANGGEHFDEVTTTVVKKRNPKS